MGRSNASRDSEEELVMASATAFCRGWMVPMPEAISSCTRPSVKAPFSQLAVARKAEHVACCLERCYLAQTGAGLGRNLSPETISASTLLEGIGRVVVTMPALSGIIWSLFQS